MKIFKYKKLYLTFLAAASFIINQLAHRFPLKTEALYSSGIYPTLSVFFARIFSLIPFSFAELSLFLLIIFAVIFVVKTVCHIIKKDVSFKSYFLKTISTFIAFSSCIYSIFIIFCGLNYARPSYAYLNKFEVVDSSIEELESLCYWIISETNSSREFVSVDDEGIFILNDSIEELSDKSIEIIRKHSVRDNFFKGYFPTAKPVISSYIMSQFNITGIYSPFTFEANINIHQPDYGIPSTMLHELSHFKGFMKESDANFISFMIGHESSESDFVYSGNMLALVHTLNAYYSVATEDEYSEIYNLLSDGVKADLISNLNYWKQFETPASEFSEKVNDSYLKSNKQESGVGSYGEMVDLLLAYYKKAA